jgi:putative oxidoreductase
MSTFPAASFPLHPRLDALGHWLAPLGLRLLLAWEFFEAGLEKWRGTNWFESIQGDFPLPFRALPASVNWQAATWMELIGATCLLLGVATRASAAMLIGLTLVATAAVHWPADWASLAELAQGYAITDAGQGNFKLPLLFVAMLLPLLFHGGGRVSVDALLARCMVRGADATTRTDPASWGALCLLAAWPVSWLLPPFGAALLIAGTVLLATAWRSQGGRPTAGGPGRSAKLAQ